MANERSIRKYILICLVILVPLGFITKVYQGPYYFWVNGQLGGLFYEMFWCLSAALIWPRANPWKIAGIVCLITCVLEFLQLWHPSFLVPVRQNFIGRTVIGHSFHWNDFPYYFSGSTLGGWFVSIIHKLSNRY